MKLLTLKEILQKTTLSKATWYRYIAEGLVPQGTKVGKRRVAWFEADAEIFIRKLNAAK